MPAVVIGGLASALRWKPAEPGCKAIDSEQIDEVEPGRGLDDASLIAPTR